MKKLMSKKGFTLVEILLYIGLMGLILVPISSFVMTMFQSRIKTQTMAEVEQQGALIMMKITQGLRNATVINSPATGASATSLSFNGLDLSKNPTIFDLSAGAIRIKEGAAANVNLMPTALVTASGLNFQNLTRTGTEGTMRIQFTLTHVNPGNRPEFNYSQTFYSTATLR